jgi:hypothetical protein
MLLGTRNTTKPILKYIRQPLCSNRTLVPDFFQRTQGRVVVGEQGRRDSIGLQSRCLGLHDFRGGILQKRFVVK